MSISPYLHFRGNCAEAMEYYAELFGAPDLTMSRYAETPPLPGMPELPPAFAQSHKIMHAEMSCLGGTLMASDYPPGVEGERQQAVSVSVSPDSIDEGRRLFDGLKDGGVVVEFGPSFFSQGFGMTKDRFGTHWIITVPPES